jgi:hypothetical protein
MVIKKENSDSGDWKTQKTLSKANSQRKDLQVAIFKKTFGDFGKILPKKLNFLKIK